MKILIKSAFVLCLIFLGAHAASAACGDSITGGTGTSVDPYQINTPAELAAIRNCEGSGNMSKYFQLMNDINLNVSPYNTGSGWTPIGWDSSPFFGKFNGDNHTISNLFINLPSDGVVGLFGNVESGGVVEKVYLSNVNIDGGSWYVGPVAGLVGGTVRNVGVTSGTVNGLTRVGGVVGSVANSGQLEKAFSSGLTVTQKAATSDCCVGGIAGAVEFGGSIADAYARTNVVHTSSGQGVFGGAVGSDYLGGSLTRLYSTGTVTTLSSYPTQVGGLVGNMGTPATDSYWDTETSGWPTSDSGTGKTTAEMKTQGTFSGWDFTNVWNIDGSTNNGYPFLRSASDTNAPLVTGFSPADNATGINLNPTFVITFNEAVIKHSGTVTLYKASDDSVIETIDVISPAIDGNETTQMTIRPSVNLLANTDYYIRIDAGAFRDLVGNNYAGISDSTTWNFTTGDYVAPVLTTISPIQSITTIANARYVFRTSATCEPLAEAPESSLTGEFLETIITPPVPGTDLIALISGIQVGGTYSVRFQCVDSDFNNSNMITVGPFTVVAPPATDSQNTMITSGYLAPKISSGNVGQISDPHSPKIFTRTLRMNMKGSDVKALQKWLNQNGFNVALLGIGSLGKETDLFGMMTKKAVMKFQASKGLKADGVVGPKTVTFMTND